MIAYFCQLKSGTVGSITIGMGMVENVRYTLKQIQGKPPEWHLKNGARCGRFNFRENS